MQLRKLAAPPTPPAPKPMAVPVICLPKASTRAELDAAFDEFMRAKGIESTTVGGAACGAAPDPEDEPDGGDEDDAGFDVEEAMASLGSHVPLSPVRNTPVSHPASRVATPPRPAARVAVARGPVVRVPPTAPAKPSFKPRPIVLDVPTSQPLPMKLIRPANSAPRAAAPQPAGNDGWAATVTDTDAFDPDFEFYQQPSSADPNAGAVDNEIDEETREVNQRFACAMLKQAYFAGADYFEYKAPARFEGLGQAVRENPVNTVYWDAGISEACADLGVPLDKLKSYHFLFLGNAMMLMPYLFNKNGAEAPKPATR